MLDSPIWKMGLSYYQGLRQSFDPGLFNRVRVNSREEALENGIAIIRDIRTAMEEYCSWADEVLEFLKGVDATWLNFSPIVDDVREAVRPHPEWVKLLK